MRIFLAGASGVIGIRLLPLLVADGHRVGAMTRSPADRDIASPRRARETTDKPLT
jgi:nucleoside-diphosphate-sugar epimerase